MELINLKKEKKEKIDYNLYEKRELLFLCNKILRKNSILRV